MSCIIAIPTIFFVLVFLPILQRTKQFGRTSIVLLIILVIVISVALIRQPFTRNHPNALGDNNWPNYEPKTEAAENTDWLSCDAV